MKTKHIALLGICFAIMLGSLIWLSKYAFIPLLVLIALAETEDLKLAALGGLFFGIASLASALILATPFAILFYNPIVSVVPRIIAGLAVYGAYKGTYKMISGLLKKKSGAPELLSGKLKRAEYISYSFGAGAGAITNTVLVLGSLMIFNYGKLLGEGAAASIINIALMLTFIPSAILEFIISILVAPPIVSALKKIE